jgi:lysozyme family protein
VRFDEVFERVVGREGGYVNDPRDPGGETKYGISKRQYPDVDIKGLTLEGAKEIYLRDYWNKIHGDELPEPVDEFLFDFAVNSGVGRAAEALQGAVGVLRDGAIGPKTIAAVGSKKLHDVIRLLFVDRAMVFALNPNDRLYGHGWFARLFDLTERALSEVR